MNTKIFILALGVTALTSCSTAYKMGQTPDDVYFSPAREQSGYVSTEKQPERYVPQESYNESNSYNAYNDYDMYRNDRFLRMSIGNRMRYSMYNDMYWMDPYSYGSLGYNTFGHNFNSPWNSYYYWNSFYNPYSSYNFYYSPYSYYPNYGGIIVPGNKTPVNNISRPRLFTPNSYTNNNYSNSNLYLYRNPAGITSQSANSNTGRYNNTNSRSESYYNNSNNNNNRSLNRTRTYNNSNNNTYNDSYTPARSNNNSYTPSRSTTVDAPTRSYSPSSSGSSGSSSSGSSGGGGISRPTRGGN